MFESFNTNAKALSRTVHQLPLRPAVLLFAWWLLHKQLYLHLHHMYPFCLTSPPTTSHLFQNCPTLHRTIKLDSSQPLYHLLTPPHQPQKTLHALLAAWAIWKAFSRWIHQGPITNDAIDQVISSAYQDELNRIKLAYPVQL